MVMGRPPKPAIIKIREGNRTKVKKSKLKPDPVGRGEPRPPDCLDADELTLWWDVVHSLPVGLLSRADESTLERMAVAWNQYRQASRMIKETGLMVRHHLGHAVRNPLLPVQRLAGIAMHQAGEMLGLSPVARARLTSDKTGDSDPMELLLGMDGDENGAWSTIPSRMHQ
jgi:P27 family predicted phage terminase small subunit